MIHVISIAPGDGGWRVCIDGRPGAGTYSSGAAAERAAREAADAFALAGEAAKLDIHLPDGAVARVLAGARRTDQAVSWRLAGDLQPA